MCTKSRAYPTHNATDRQIMNILSQSLNDRRHNGAGTVVLASGDIGSS
jgi:hypothetical protein